VSRARVRARARARARNEMHGSTFGPGEYAHNTKSYKKTNQNIIYLSENKEKEGMN
jgi:hypothetical protein